MCVCIFLCVTWGKKHDGRRDNAHKISTPQYRPDASDIGNVCCGLPSRRRVRAKVRTGLCKGLSTGTHSDERFGCNPENESGRLRLSDTNTHTHTHTHTPAVVRPVARFVGDRTPRRVHDSPADQHHRAQSSRLGGGQPVHRFCARGVGEKVGEEM